MNKFVFAVLVCILSILTSRCNKKGEPQQHPNIIIILADDLGYGDVKIYYPEAKVETPNIDKLAKGGMRFTNAHAPTSVCTPTRYSILTGRYAWRSRLKKGVLWPWDPPLIEKDRLTLPKMLKENVYNTAAIGKWHLGWNWPTMDSLTAMEAKGENVNYSEPVTGGPVERGFDYYYGDDVPNFPPYTFIENDLVVEMPTVEKPDSMFGHAGVMAKGWKLENVMPAITQKAVEYIEKQKAAPNPYFLYFALTAPHTPIAPTDEFLVGSNAGRYGDYVQEVDWTVGEIMKVVERSGKADNTIIIFTSDNGSPARNGDKYGGPVGSVITDFGHKANGDWRGFKGDAWESGHRVPFIVSWRGRVSENTVNDGLISSFDLLATMNEVLSFENKYDVPNDGVSMADNWLNGEQHGRDYLIHHSHRGVFAVRKGDWLFIDSNVSGGFSDGLNPAGYGISTPGQLYNLKEDPSETNNLYSQYPEKIEELKELLESVKKIKQQISSK